MADTAFYKRSNFVTHLPLGRLYTPSHFWIESEGPDLWRVGFTKFATRMLGEIVDQQWEVAPGATVAVGEIIGSVEGFKAISDVYCALAGTWEGSNEGLREHAELVGKDPYGAGWLYRVRGIPDVRAGSVETYQGLLNGTIDRMLSTHGEYMDEP